jgi:hypothetical protein
MKRILVLAGVLLGLLGCSNATTAPKETTWISRELTGGGFSVGPSYLVTIFTDGRVVFKGISDVKRQETLTKRISPKAVAPLFAKLTSINFEQLKDRYDRHELANGTIVLPPTDTPIVILTLQVDGRSKRIEDISYAPSDVKALSEMVRESANVADWIGRPTERKT